MMHTTIELRRYRPPVFVGWRLFLMQADIILAWWGIPLPEAKIIPFERRHG